MLSDIMRIFLPIYFSPLRRGDYVFICFGLFVSTISKKTVQPIFIKFDGMLAHGLRKKMLDFVDNAGNVTLCLGLG